MGVALGRLGGFKAVTVMSGSLPYSDVNFPSRNKILERVAGLADIVRPEDQVLFFFSGHGINDRSGSSYLLPIDAQVKDPVATGIDLQREIAGPLEAAGAKNLLFLIDACQKTVVKDKGLAVVGVNEVRAPGEAVVITATGKGKASYEDPKGANGLFTRGILAALNGEADLDGDGAVSVTELEAYLPDAVSEYAFTAGLSQKPAVFDAGRGKLQPPLARLAVARPMAAAPNAAPASPNASPAGATPPAAASAKAQFVTFKLPEGVRADVRLLSAEGREIRAWSDTASFSEKLEPGSYRVEAQDRGYLYYPYGASFTVGASKVGLALELKPNFGSLELSCDPAEGVDILLNGEKRGALSGGQAAIDRLKSGNYELVLSKELYDTKRQAIQIEDGKKAKVAVSLSPNFFTLNVSEKGGQSARLYVDGQDRGSLPATLKLPFREANLRVVSADPRYREWSDTVRPSAKGAVETRVAALLGRTGTLEVTTVPEAEASISLVPAGGGQERNIGQAPLDYEALIGDYRVSAHAAVGGKQLTASATVSLREGQLSPLRLELKEARLLPRDLRIEKPSVESLREDLRDFPFSAAPNADMDEARAMLRFLGAERFSFDRPDLGCVSALFAQGVEVTIWPATYNKAAVYGIRFGIPDARHSYFGSNDSYFEIEKRLKPASRASGGQSALPPGFVLVPAGSFLMGTRPAEADRDTDEGPQHEVRLSAFMIGQYEVTQAEWAAIMGSNPSRFKGDRLPVEQVSWYDILVYCNKRSMKEGLGPCYSISGSTDPARWGSVPTSRDTSWNAAICNFTANGYRLPTEAEWEYAAKGGPAARGLAANAAYAGSASLDAVAWYRDNSEGKTHLVGQKAANALGLYDMAGNVWEWCWDWYGSYTAGALADPQGAAGGAGRLRVNRGGSWNYGAASARSANRDYGSPEGRYFYLGFRLLRRP